MGLKSDLEEDVATIFRKQWTTRDGAVVPDEGSVQLGNDAVKIEATVLYADISGSTTVVDDNVDYVAAEIYKAFLHCAAKIIRSEGGVITAYDGDRVMAVYIGDNKNTSAVRSAIKIHDATEKIVNPAKSSQYSDNTEQIKHVVGVDTSHLFVARTGVRGANDLVWVGRAANYAAKLTALPDSYATYITAEVYNRMHEPARTTNGQAMWESVRWNTFDDRIIYRSNWWWSVKD